MRPSDYYEAILASINDDLERRVFGVLAAHIGETVGRAQMISLLFGETVEDTTLASNQHDRAIRKCIENLRSKDHPIVSTSGEAGYCLTDDPEKVRMCIAEQRSRIVKMQKQIEHLERSTTMARSLRQWREGQDMPVQARLF